LLLPALSLRRICFAVFAESDVRQSRLRGISLFFHSSAAAARQALPALIRPFVADFLCEVRLFFV
jgi:hypothetical protein